MSNKLNYHHGTVCGESRSINLVCPFPGAIHEGERNMSESQIYAPSTSRCVVTLVHGTCGFLPRRMSVEHEGDHENEGSPSASRSNSDWFAFDSSFHKELARQLKELGVEHRIRSFEWSGSNSIFVRNNAAVRLSKLLELDAAADPQAFSVVIGHSHGGNVALLALERLTGNLDHVRIVTLATPFLRVFVMRASKNFTNVQFLATPLLLILLTYFLMPATSWLVQATWIKHIANFNFDLVPMVLFLLFGLASFRLAGWIIRLIVNPDFRLPGEWKLSPKWRDRPQRIAAASYYSPAVCSRLLVIRGVDDEASFALDAGSIGARLTNVVMELIGRLAFTELARVARFRWIALMLFVSLLWGAGFLLSLLGVSSDLYLAWLWTITVILLYALGVSLIILPVLLCLPGIFKAAFGREFLVGAGCCTLAADSVPDTNALADVITLPPAEERDDVGLRHSIYKHPMCVGKIVIWLRGQLIATPVETS